MPFLSASRCSRQFFRILSPVRLQVTVLSWPTSTLHVRTLSTNYQRKAIDPYLKEPPYCLTESLDLLKKLLDVLGVLHNALFDSESLLKQAGKFLEEGKGNDEDSDSVGKISEEEAKKLTQLKETLLNSNKFLVSALPDIEKIKHASNTISKAITNLKPSRLEQLVPESLVTEEDLLCSVLGLNDQVANRLRNLGKGIRNHKTDLYFSICFLKESYESSDTEALPDDAARLQRMGFSENRSNVIANWIAEQPLPKHKPLLAWAEIYLENLFKYDIFLNDLVSPFSYEENRLNEWFTHDVERDREEDGRLIRKSGTISAINTTTIEEAEARIQEKITEFRNGNTEGKLYFHGTDHKSAKNILENGIKLEMGAKECDFSHGKGFYITNDFMYALHYAYAKNKATAVIIFNISDPYLQSSQCLDLSGHSNREDWLSVTSFFRSGEDRRKRPNESLYNQIESCHCIIGPIKEDGVHGGLKPQELIQICIKNTEMAREIGNPSQVVGTVFLNTRDTQTAH